MFMTNRSSRARKPEYVLAAEAAVKAKEAELDEAQEALAMAEKELCKARSDFRAAWIEADSTLPKCRIVYLRWPSFKDSGATFSKVVIVRKTAGGRLVVREAGRTEAAESQFCFDDPKGVFRRVGKRSSYDLVELRDVPEEFMPAVDEKNT